MSFDLLIKGGTVVDGTGCEPYVADVAISGDKVVAVGTDLGEAEKVYEADGCYVAPGFVDIHTHYDGQATWDQEMAPSSWHGVTTVVMGNCGVGFAPAAPDRHDWLIGLMEGVEDIPGSALSEGMSWNWESFPEYLDALEEMPRTVDVATHVPHGAVRAYVMGDRGAANENPTESDIARMANIVEEGLRAGALGFSTSRTVLHKSIDGELVPGTTATPEELIGIGRGMARVGHGVFEMASDLVPEWNEFDWMGDLSRETGLPVTFTALQSPIKAMSFDDQMAQMREQNAQGANILAQISMRGTGLILGWRCTFNPFSFKPSWAEVAELEPAAQHERLSDPAFKAKLISEESIYPDSDIQILAEMMAGAWTMQYELSDGFNYEPTAAESIAGLAAAANQSPEEFAYDLMMRDGGNGFIYFPLLNYADGNLNFLEPILQSDDCINSLSDGGAHCGTICDAASPTFMLQHWVRDRDGFRLSLSEAIKRQCADTAKVYGLDDRGILAPGYLADINVIELDKIGMSRPWVATDLPAGGKRLLQSATGYKATFKSGVMTFDNGQHSGATPGGLIRGPQASPADSERDSALKAAS
ncbi:N-acyl-D-aspartate/D-glutamate deacylase [gamma proteobacterium HIMB55]|nr:N-acyl-D-aspartate/D-glutamate deacylase [gamma proteobacterium HIMB55]